MIFRKMGREFYPGPKYWFPVKTHVPEILYKNMPRPAAGAYVFQYRMTRLRIKKPVGRVRAVAHRHGRKKMEKREPQKGLLLHSPPWTVFRVFRPFVVRFYAANVKSLQNITAANANGSVWKNVGYFIRTRSRVIQFSLDVRINN